MKFLIDQMGSPVKNHKTLLLFIWVIIVCSNEVLAKSRHLISDSEIRERENQCYADVESGLWGSQCNSSMVAKENCVLRCLSPSCYKLIYESHPLEEGEKDYVRSQEYKYCMHRELRMLNTWGWGEAGTQIAGFMFIISMFKQFLPDFISDYFRTLNSRILTYFRREITITFPQSSSSGHGQSKVYKTIETYLGSKSTVHAKRLKADAVMKRHLVLTMDDSEEIVDVFEGVVLRWFLLKTYNKSKSISWYPSDGEKRAYILTFQAKYRYLVTNTYLEHVLQVGREIEAKQRQIMLYTNNPSKHSDYMWSEVEFKHPATFDTLGIDSKLKDEIMFDLTAFSNGKNHYEKIGKAWKRGYLLYGPPGTGKSTMIAAMANYMDYDIYDIELTTVKDNSELRNLLINIGSKSLIVIEDIHCSLDLTGERKKKDKSEGDSSLDNPILQKAKEDDEGDGESKVTLPGLLNFIDGIWSACGGERIIVFTVNYLKSLSFVY